MQQVERVPAEFDKLGKRHTRDPGPSIVITAHHGQRRQLAQAVQHVGATNVTGVENMVHAAQRAQGLRPQQPVGVGDNA